MVAPGSVLCTWQGLTEAGGHELGALEASLRGVEACHGFVVNIASDRFGWDMGTRPVEDGGQGLRYKVLQPGDRLYDAQMARRFAWILDPDKVCDPGGDPGGDPNAHLGALTGAGRVVSDGGRDGALL